MIFRIFSKKDTFITNVQKRAVQQTGSNFGASEVLELFKIAGVSGSTGTQGSASLSRILVEFDFSSFADLTASGKAPSSGYSAVLKLKDLKHVDTVPSSFEIQLAPISQSWNEGKGIDIDTYLDKGVANWDKAKTNTLWTKQGGDILLEPTASYSFDTGLEDVEVDITTMVGSWLTGGLPNYGLMVRLTASAEKDASDYFVKKFSSRETIVSAKEVKPTIEIKWDDSLKDDRNNFLFDITSSLYLHNTVRGQQLDIPKIGTADIFVTIKDVSGSIITWATGSHVGLTGIYNVSMVLPTGSYSGSLFSDEWGSGSYSFFTGSFTPGKQEAVDSLTQNQFVVNIKNLKDEYELNEDVRFNLFVRHRDYSPAVVQTSSLGIPSVIITKGYYRIDNDLTNEQVIPFGTGSIEYTRLSYDKNGNYFSIKTNSLIVGNVYKVLFLFDEYGQKQVIDRGLRFKVV